MTEEVSVIVECRETRRGAFTAVTEHDPEVTVEELEKSGTGRHWKERVTGPIGARYFLTDITNSGKDHSAWHTLREESTNETLATENLDPSGLQA